MYAGFDLKKANKSKLEKIKLINAYRMKIAVFGLLLLVLLFTRLYNLENTARFIWDESSDLVKIHQYWIEKKITLVGPIDETGLKVFGSLTYYMLIPFAVMGNFDPISPVYGTVFFGVMLAFALMYLTYLLNKKLIFFAALLVMVWYPLVQTSRWAWNPNLIPFWLSLGLIFFQFKKRWTLLLAGLFLGLSIHHHYYAFFAIAAFSLATSSYYAFKKEFINILILNGGIFLAISPFLIFDLRHPPGLFLAGVHSNVERSNFLTLSMISATLNNFWMMFEYFSRHVWICIVVIGLSIVMLLADIKYKAKAALYAIPWVFQPIAISYLPQVFEHYILPAVVFYFVWIIYPRKKIGEVLAVMLLISLIIGGIISIVPQLHKSDWQTDIPAVRIITNLIEDEVKTKQLKNVNIAVLGSPDTNTYGRRYRDMLLIRDMVLLSKYEYFIADHLYIITLVDEKSVRSDPAPEMHNFRTGKLESSWNIPNSEWKLYRFTRGVSLREE